MKRKFIIFSLVISILILPVKEIFAEKRARDHARIWLKFGLDAIGIGHFIRLGKATGLFKPETWEVFGEIVKGGRSLRDAYRKLQDPTGMGWMLFTCTTAANIYATMVESLLGITNAPLRVITALLDAGYEYLKLFR